LLGFLGGVAVLLLATVAPADNPVGPDCDTSTWGTLTGRVVWQGDLPARPVLQVARDRDCCGQVATADDWVIDPKSHGVCWALVWLMPEPDREPKALPLHPAYRKLPAEVQVDQVGCRYRPHVFGIRAGQKLIVTNRDRIVHNLWFSHPQGLDTSLALLPGKEHTLEGFKASPTPGMFRCAIHPWMRAFVRVFDHPYFAVTEWDGKFVIRHAPPGRWRLVIWHPDHGFRSGAAGRGGFPVEVPGRPIVDLGELELNP
jgi:hypothetical protein